MSNEIKIRHDFVIRENYSDKQIEKEIDVIVAGIRWIKSEQQRLGDPDFLADTIATNRDFLGELEAELVRRRRRQQTGL